MSRTWLLTGGAGFIGVNYADRLLGRGERVTLLDNLSRRGADANVEWLRERHGERAFELRAEDIRDSRAVDAAVAGADVLVHLAAQVAVTTSVQDPRTDFETNALGTLNVLEAARLSARRPLVVYASTNKVYGGMEDADVVEDTSRYRYARTAEGIAEDRPLDFHSPYGCSKGAGDQYVRDYHRIYGLPTVVLRQSCIYGPRQFGVEDQGWVAWLVIAAVTGRPITIYGDGKQVRDLLHVHDLARCFDRVVDRIDVARGKVYNIGGGPDSTLSVWSEFAPLLEEVLGHAVPAAFRPWRPGDQRVYVSDIRRARNELDWRPQVSLREGIEGLVAWVREHHALLQRTL